MDVIQSPKRLLEQPKIVFSQGPFSFAHFHPDFAGWANMNRWFALHVYFWRKISRQKYTKNYSETG
jgi:hypothetical protein